MGEDELSSTKVSNVLKLIYFFQNAVDKHITWFRESVVLPNRQKSYWYHEKIRRVPTIDQCYSDDFVCIYEANQQYHRDRLVEKNILYILRKRWENCVFEKNSGEVINCNHLLEAYEKSVNNYFIKYGDLGFKENAISCFMKQKHRMAWERRHGPVGTGRKDQRPLDDVQ